MGFYHYSEHRDISFAPCDRTNPSNGYFIRVTDSMNGNTILYSAVHPVTGADLTLQTCLEVAAMYVEQTA